MRTFMTLFLMRKRPHQKQARIFCRWRPEIELLQTICNGTKPQIGPNELTARLEDEERVTAAVTGSVFFLQEIDK
jgi:hypothetical protein